MKDLKEHTQQQVEEMFRVLMESLPNAILLVDARGSIRLGNAQAGRLFGYDREELLDLPIESLVPERFQANHPELVAKFMAQPSTRGIGVGRDLHGRHKDGHEIPVEIGLSPIQTVDGLLVLAVIVNLTERKRAEERFRLVVEAVPSAILLVDEQGLMTLVNRQAERMFGYTRQELLGQPIEILLPARFRATHAGHHSRFFTSIGSRGMGAGRELYGLHKDGRELLVEIGLSPIQTEGGQQVLASITDITERKAKEEEIRLAHDLQASREAADRASQAKSEFLSRMSHELRTPLNAILGFGQLLEVDIQSPKPQQHVQHILKGGRHLLSLINEILDISRIEAGNMTVSLDPVEVFSAIGEALDLVRPHAGARKIQLLSTVARAEAVYVMADQQRLKQVLLNLFSNGVKYNKDGGRLTVSGQTMAEGRYRIVVADTGGGIAPALLSRLFTPFDRLGKDSLIEGTGLGLVLSRGLVEALGGAIAVQSVVVEGTTITVELSLAKSPTRRAAPAVEEGLVTASQPGVSYTVLYIEDNLSNYQLIEVLLSRRPGVKLLGAMQGRLGLELAATQHPDLILLDLHLPDIQGDQVLLRLRKDPETAAIPVIMLSADAMQRDIDQLLAAGAQGYLTKPVNVAQLYRLLDEQLAKKGVGR
ncbi:MAG: PAS domain S-box protein [Nitrospirae bacterium]|nr:PAS domain S-box protein [Nitrospirota bacterium]